MNILKTVLSHQLTFRYADILWLKSFITGRTVLRFAVVTAASLFAVIVLQLLYPRSWALPNTQIVGQNFGFRSRRAIAASLTGLENRDVAVQTEAGTYNPSFKDMGIKLEAETMAVKATAYPLRDRLVPFSWFTRRNTQDTLRFSLDESTATKYVQSLEKTNLKPVNASVTIVNGTVKVTPAKTGFSYKTENTRALFASVLLTKQFSITLYPELAQPAITSAVAQDVANKVTAQINDITVTAGREQNVAKKDVVSTWITLTPNEAAGTINIGYNTDAIKTFLKSFSNKLYIAETPNRITLVDGEQLTASGGKTGQILAMDTSVDAIVTSLKQGSTTATAVVQTVTPSTQFDRRYTKSSKGLQALIDYWVSIHSGRYAVTFQRTDGSLSASYNQTSQFTTASVYKMYVAYGIYHKIEAGELSEDTMTSAGKSVSGCIEVMIVVSDNACGVALATMVGWSTINTWLNSLGLTSTDISKGYDLVTTSKEAATFLKQLDAGTLMNTSHTSALLNLMKQQIYRSAIPAGVSGIVVADKVGWLTGINNDAAIVYDPDGTYILVIMTENSSWGGIKDLTSQINSVLRQ